MPKVGQPELYALLDEMGIGYDYIEHPEARTVEEALRYCAGFEGRHCKNIFLRNHKGDKHYLVVVDCHHTVDIRRLWETLGEGRLSFASEQRLMRFLGVRPGSVSPFGLINDTGREVTLYLDENLRQAERLSFHPNDNRASISVTLPDLMRFLDRLGNRREWRPLY